MKTIAIGDIPGKLTFPKFPYAEWVGMPVGRAVEVELHGRNVTGCASNIARYLAVHHPGMKVMQRKGHLYVARVAEAE